LASSPGEVGLAYLNDGCEPQFVPRRLVVAHTSFFGAAVLSTNSTSNCWTKGRFRLRWERAMRTVEIARRQVDDPNKIGPHGVPGWVGECRSAIDNAAYQRRRSTQACEIKTALSRSGERRGTAGHRRAIEGLSADVSASMTDPRPAHYNSSASDARGAELQESRDRGHAALQLSSGGANSFGQRQVGRGR